MLLTTLPDATLATKLREYYRMWIKLNGVFIAQIRNEHADFFNWLADDR